MTAFVKLIKLPKSGGNGVLQTAYPLTTEIGVINIICGPNNCGKTYLLRKLRATLVNYEKIDNDASSDLHIEMTNRVSEPLEILYFGKSWQDKDRAGIIPVEKSALELPGDRPPYRHATLSFLRRQLNHHFPEKTVSLDDWLNNVDIRMAFLERLELECKLYKCLSADEIVKRIELLLGGRLFFRKTSKKSVELAIVTSQNLAVPYPEWSDGQKAAFYLLLMLDYSQPKILLLDEIENHLHPLYMTSIMHFIKESVRQAFISTHHPHVIFTELADRVFYLETIQTPIDVRQQSTEKVISYTKVDRQGARQRNVSTLNEGFQKISATYKLFDLQDRQLLKQSSNVTSYVEIEFYKAFLDIFSLGVAKASDKIVPDRQTQLLGNVIKKAVGRHPQNKALRILEIGAGLGRAVKELSKLSTWQIDTSIHWTCWEPNDELRQRMKEILTEARIEAHIPNSSKEIPESNCDIALLSNVLHEVTPDDFADLIYTAFQAIRNNDNGKIVILEIYPLLRAEKYAVAYPYSSLLNLFNKSGFYCTSDTFSINDAQGYCVVIKPANHDISRNLIKENLIGIWDDIEKGICSSYACQEEINSYIEYRRMILELTTLASITAWKHGIWKSQNRDY